MLAQDQIRLGDYFQRLVLETYQVSPRSVNTNIRCVTNTLLVAIAASAGFPLLSIARKFAKGNQDLANLYSYGFITSVAALNIWGIYDFQKYLDAKSLINSSESNLKKRIHAISAIILAIITAIANAPINYFYNNSIFLTLQGFICDVFLLSCTYQRIITSNYLSFFRASRYEKKILAVLNLLNKQLDIGSRYVINLPPDSRKQFIHDIKFSNSENLSIEENSARLIICKLIHLSKPIVQRNESYEWWYNGLPRKIFVNFFGFVFPLLWSYISFNAISQGFKELIGESPSRWFLTLPSVILSYVLEVILTHKTLTKIYDSLTTLCIGTFQRNIPWSMFTYKQLLSSLWGLFTISFAFASRAQVAEDFAPESYKNFFVAFIIIVTIAFKSASLQVLVNDIFHFFIRRYAAPDTQELARFIFAVEKFRLVNEVASKEQIVEFINGISDSLNEDGATPALELTRCLGELNELKSIAESTAEEKGNQTNTKISSSRFEFFESTNSNNENIKTKEIESISLDNNIKAI